MLYPKNSVRLKPYDKHLFHLFSFLGIWIFVSTWTLLARVDWATSAQVESWFWLLLSHSVVPASVRPHGQQPTRLLCPWDFPGKSTGVGCHCFLRKVGSVWLNCSLISSIPHVLLWDSNGGQWLPGACFSHGRSPKCKNQATLDKQM